MSLSGRRIVVGVCGGIAAFKSVELVRELGRRGAEVRVAMTPSAKRFVGPMTFTALTSKPPVTDLFDPAYEGEVHVELGHFADAMVIAPATMSVLASAAAGVADGPVLATYACMDAPVLMAPAMHTRMWRRATTRRAVAQLLADGVAFVGPVEGPLANGEIGEGRMAEPAAIADALEALLGERRGDLAGKRVLVSAGPTFEDLDPVRFLGNRSTGRMGYAIARRAVARGAEVVLVSGPTALPDPPGLRTVRVRSALEMHAAITAQAASMDVIVMAAAVADYRPAERAEHKLKKAGEVSLRLVRNPDILAELGAGRQGPRPILVGFALETEDVLAHARGKLERKKADFVVANHASDGFGGNENLATIVSSEGDEALPRMSKDALADHILDRAISRLNS